MLDLLRPYFADKLLVDDREASFTFEIPGLDGNNAYGVLLPKLAFWKQLVNLLILNTFIMMVFAILIYKLIIQQRSKHKLSAYLMGSGVLLPLVILLPYYVLESLQLENIVLKMSAGIPPTVLVFRILAAMYDTSPPVVEDSLENYVWHCSSMVTFCFSTKTNKRLKISLAEFKVNLWRIVVQYVLLSLLVSLGLHVGNFQPFASPVVVEDYHLTFDLFQPGQLFNNYLLAWTTFLTLSFGFNLVAFGHNLQGFKTPDIFQNPMLLSTSPSDFWSKRWNSLIQSDLKHGIFRPLVKVVPTKLAVVVTFLCSGILHDYNWTIMFYHSQDTILHRGENLFYPIVWKQTAFFGWNGIVMLLEQPLGKLAVCKWASRNLPRPVLATLLCLTVVPVAHWFAGDWVRGGLYESYTLGLIRIIQI